MPYAKEYYEKHKTEINEKRRLWAKEKYECDCGAVFRRDRKSEHLKLSLRHQNYCKTIEGWNLNKIMEIIFYNFF